MVPNGQNVKSGDVLLTDGHERARNFLSDGEMDALLEASKMGRHGVREFPDPAHDVSPRPARQRSHPHAGART